MADFFSKSVREMTLAEIELLYSERVPENIRLEYKEQLPVAAGAEGSLALRARRRAST